MIYFSEIFVITKFRQSIGTLSSIHLICGCCKYILVFIIISDYFSSAYKKYVSFAINSLIFTFPNIILPPSCPFFFKCALTSQNLEHLWKLFEQKVVFYFHNSNDSLHWHFFFRKLCSNRLEKLDQFVFSTNVKITSLWV